MSDGLTARIRRIVGDDPNVGEIRMFGGICFTLNGNMMAGTMKNGSLLVQVGNDQEATALSLPGASRMNLTGREMKGFVLVTPDALDDEALQTWIALASSHVGAMPPKKTAKPKSS